MRSWHGQSKGSVRTCLSDTLPCGSWTCVLSSFVATSLESGTRSDTGTDHHHVCDKDMSSHLFYGVVVLAVACFIQIMSANARSHFLAEVNAHCARRHIRAPPGPAWGWNCSSALPYRCAVRVASADACTFQWHPSSQWQGCTCP